MPPLTIGKCGMACSVASMRRPSLESMLEDYWRLMPEYQNVDLSILQPLRILFGFFPTYRQVVIPSALLTNCLMTQFVNLLVQMMTTLTRGLA